MHINPAFAGVLAAFAFGGRADAGGTVILVLVGLLALVFAADGLVAMLAHRPAAVPTAKGR